MVDNYTVKLIVNGVALGHNTFSSLERADAYYKKIRKFHFGYIGNRHDVTLEVKVYDNDNNTTLATRKILY